MYVKKLQTKYVLQNINGINEEAADMKVSRYLSFL